MTVHWNSRRGFAAESQTATSLDAKAAEDQARLQLAELLCAMRKTHDVRPACLQRGKRLLADPGYPSQEVLKAVAGVLAGKLEIGNLE